MVGEHKCVARASDTTACLLSLGPRTPRSLPRRRVSMGSQPEHSRYLSTCALALQLPCRSNQVAISIWAKTRSAPAVIQDGSGLQPPAPARVFGIYPTKGQQGAMTSFSSEGTEGRMAVLNSRLHVRCFLWPRTSWKSHIYLSKTIICFRPNPVLWKSIRATQTDQTRADMSEQRRPLILISSEMRFAR